MRNYTMNTRKSRILNKNSTFLVSLVFAGLFCFSPLLLGPMFHIRCVHMFRKRFFKLFICNPKILNEVINIGIRMLTQPAFKLVTAYQPD